MGGVTMRGADVIVVGAGGSGLAAAVAAAESGSSVIVLERRPQAGGTTALSVGSMTAAQSSFQRRAGISDSPDDMVEDMWLFDSDLLDGDAPDLRRLLAAESASTLEWLREHGVAFAGPFPEPPHRVPRMHNVIPASSTYIVRLIEACRRLGVEVRLASEATELVIENETVVGVRGAQHGIPFELRAGKGVILAAGDFSGNAEMRRRYLPDAAATATPVNPDALGLGHLMAVEAGAGLHAMDRVFGPQLRFPPPPRNLIELLPTWRWLCRIEAAVVSAVPASWLRPVVKWLLVSHMSPSDALFREGAILLDHRGERFGDESVPAVSLAGRPEARGFIVMDEIIANRFNHAPHHISTAPGIAFAYYRDYLRGRPDLVVRAGTPEDLAHLIQADPRLVQQALASTTLTAPYVALGPVHSVLTVTEGGVAVDDHLRVLRPDGSRIPGLFAAGGTGQGGLMLLGHGHHIAWAMVSGRTAGRSASVLLRESR
jgi:fumarate reductase flavoprotein subunit